MSGPITGDPFLDACAGRPVTRTPVWFMRQAGRSLPEYRALRGHGSILSAIQQPDLAAEITLQPVRRYGVDAAVLFSDIVTPVAAVGFGVDIQPGVGPVTAEPFADERDLERLRPLEADIDMPWLAPTVEMVMNETSVPVIGFAGGPFTLASYLIEGRPSRDFVRTKALMYGDPDLWRRLTDRLADLAADVMIAQVRAGAQALQLFESWAGALSPRDYEQYVLPAARHVFDRTADLGVPRIHFGVGTGELLGLMAYAGPEVLGVDWRVPLSVAAQRAPGVAALQGNLDPTDCFGPWDHIRQRILDILSDRPAGFGHIFNLGHGVLPETDPDVLKQVVDFVHETTAA